MPGFLYLKQINVILSPVWSLKIRNIVPNHDGFYWPLGNKIKIEPV